MSQGDYAEETYPFEDDGQMLSIEEFERLSINEPENKDYTTVIKELSI